MLFFNWVMHLVPSTQSKQHGVGEALAGRLLLRNTPCKRLQGNHLTLCPHREEWAVLPGRFFWRCERKQFCPHISSYLKPPECTGRPHWLGPYQWQVASLRKLKQQHRVWDLISLSSRPLRNNLRELGGRPRLELAAFSWRIKCFYLLNVFSLLEKMGVQRNKQNSIENL